MSQFRHFWILWISLLFTVSSAEVLADIETSDLSSFLLQAAKSSRTGEASARRLYKTQAPQVVFVNGLFQELVDAQTKKQTGNDIRGFHYHQDYLKKQGIGSQLAPTHTVGTMWDNARIISDTVVATKSPVILVCHSKGCIDALHFLLMEEFPDAQSQVVGFVSLAGPHFGSYFADLATYYSSYLGGLDDLVIRWLNGTMLVGTELSTNYRTRYMEKNKDALETLAKHIPILSVAANNLPTSGDTSHFGVLGSFLRKLYSVDNDGLVATKSAIVPGSCMGIIINQNHNDLLWGSETLGAGDAMYAYLATIEQCRSLRGNGAP